MRIAIVGAGSLGTILGAFIQKGGYEVELVDANRPHVEALNDKGARIIGTTEMAVEVKAITPDQMSGVYDLVFLMVKQTVNSLVIEQLQPFLDKDSIVCTLQNGVPEIEVDQLVGGNRVIGGAVLWGASYVEPGVSELTQTMEDVQATAFTIGEIDGAVTERIQRVKTVLDCMGGTEITENLMGMRWLKLLMNAAASGMSTVLGCSFGEILDDKQTLETLTRVAREVVLVADAQNIVLPEYHSLNLADIYRYSNLVGLDKAMQISVHGWSGARKSKASMLQDIEKGRKTEIDFINGTVVQVGSKVRVETPINGKIVEIVKQIENGEMSPAFKNKEYFLKFNA